MERRSITTKHTARQCPGCGSLLRNPGQHKTLAWCVHCDRYVVWYERTVTRVVWDDGRDEQGRFHHKPYTVECSTQHCD